MTGTLVATSVTTSVTVVAVEDGPTSSSYRWPSGLAKHITLRAEDGRSWTAVVAISNLPPDLIRPGDQLDFWLDAAEVREWIIHVDQPFAFARGPELVLFAAHREGQRLQMPDLSGYGRTLEDSTMTCPALAGSCGDRHFLRASAAGQPTTLAPGTSGRVASLLLNLEEAVDGYRCSDGLSVVLLAGFRAP